MKNFFLSILPLTVLVMPGECAPEYVNNSRIYIEGTTNTPNISVILKNEDILISETTTDAKGNFGLGGAGTTKSPELIFNKKIKSYQTATSGCTLSYDSTEIYLPASINYIRFNQIQFK